MDVNYKIELFSDTLIYRTLNNIIAGRPYFSNNFYWIINLIYDDMIKSRYHFQVHIGILCVFNYVTNSTI